MNILLRKRFGLPADPWAGFHLHTADALRTAQAIEAAAEARLFVSILGARGSGKTHAVRQALRSLREVHLIEPLRLSRERLHIGDIECAIVRELAQNERPRRSGEARSHQVRRVLGHAARNRRIVLLIDDAHALHHATLRAMKRLRELSWLGVSPLLGIALAGQADRAGAIPEVGLRSDRLRLGGLLPEEAAEALRRALNRSTRTLIAPEAIAPLAASPRSRNWLDLAALVDDCLAEAAARGENRITAKAARAVLYPEQRTATDFRTPPAADDETVADLLTRLDDAGERQSAVA